MKSFPFTNQSFSPRSLVLAFGLIFLLVIGPQANSQNPVLSVRFANPQFQCTTQQISFDVEFQSSMPDKQLFGMNVRFFYADQDLEFIGFTNFAEGYGAFAPNPPYVSTGNATSGLTLFGLTGPSEFINGAIQLLNPSANPIILSTTGWTRLFSINFHVDNQIALLSGSFYPSLIWDLEQNTANGGFPVGDEGVVMTVVAPAPLQSASCCENVTHFNWGYDAVAGYPFGYPALTNPITPQGIAIAENPVGQSVCAGSALSLSVTTAGGSGNGLYQWMTSVSPEGPFIPVLENGNSPSLEVLPGLEPAFYRVLVQDAVAACGSATSTVATVSTLGVPAAEVDSLVNAGMNLANGAINLLVNGGTSPFSFSWSNGCCSLDAQLSGLAAANYTVTVTDANNCTSSLCFSIGVQLPSIVSQSIPLTLGWNLISTYVVPTSLNLTQIWSPIVQKLKMVKDELGNVYLPQFNLNMIGNWTLGKAYQVNMILADTLVISGIQIVPETTPLCLPTSWSNLAYLRNTQASATTIMSSIKNNVELMKDNLGGIYWPIASLPNPINTIGNMKPGQGYKIKMLVASQFTYPANQAVGQKNHGEVGYATRHFGAPVNTGTNMTVAIPEEAWPTRPESGDELAVFGPSGILVGSILCDGNTLALSVWGDDNLSPERDGLQAGEPFSLVLYRHRTGEEVPVHVGNWERGSNSFEENAISIAGRVLVSTPQALLALLPNSPNPFADQTNIRFELATPADVTIRIFNLFGDLVDQFNLAGLSTGVNEIPYQAHHLAMGDYVYQVSTQGFQVQAKMAVAR